MEGPQSKGQVAVGEKLGAGEGRILGEERSGQASPRKSYSSGDAGERRSQPSKHWVGMSQAHRRPVVRNGVACLRDQGARVMNWTKQEGNHSGRDWQSRQRRVTRGLGAFGGRLLCTAAQ